MPCVRRATGTKLNAKCYWKGEWSCIFLDIAMPNVQ